MRRRASGTSSAVARRLLMTLCFDAPQSGVCPSPCAWLAATGDRRGDSRLAVPVAGLLIYRPRAEARARAELVETLNRRAEIRAAAISRWADVGLRDAQLVANYPSAVELLRTPTIRRGRIASRQNAPPICRHQGIRPGAHRPRRAGRGPSGQSLDLARMPCRSRHWWSDRRRLAHARGWAHLGDLRGAHRTVRPPRCGGAARTAGERLPVCRAVAIAAALRVDRVESRRTARHRIHLSDAAEILWATGRDADHRSRVADGASAAGPSPIKRCPRSRTIAASRRSSRKPGRRHAVAGDVES